MSSRGSPWRLGTPIACAPVSPRVGIQFGAKEIAKKYITYRYKQSLLRQANTTDKQILSLIECNNEDVKQENSNKNPTINSVQRDYMAGEVSKDVYYTIHLHEASRLGKFRDRK